MKAAAFDYVRAADIDEVCRLLANAGGEERKIIAGGQTLVPLMAMRMARPPRRARWRARAASWRCALRSPTSTPTGLQGGRRRGGRRSHTRRRG